MGNWNEFPIGSDKWDRFWRIAGIVQWVMVVLFMIVGLAVLWEGFSG